MLLCKFCAHIEGLPQNVDKVDASHPLVAYANDPTGCVEEGKDAWEKFNGPLNCLLQKPPNELQYLVCRGEKGLIGLCQFLEYLVQHHGISGCLIEGKLEWLMQAINEV